MPDLALVQDPDIARIRVEVTVDEGNRRLTVRALGAADEELGRRELRLGSSGLDATGRLALDAFVGQIPGWVAAPERQ